MKTKTKRAAASRATTEKTLHDLFGNVLRLGNFYFQRGGDETHEFHIEKHTSGLVRRRKPRGRFRRRNIFRVLDAFYCRRGSCKEFALLIGRSIPKVCLDANLVAYFRGECVHI